MATMPTGARAGRDPAGLGGLRWRLAQLEDQNAALREELQRLEAERERLRGENERLRAERDRFQAANERLRAEVDALRRAAKRQAAPFSKDDPTPSPKRPAAGPARPTAPAPTDTRQSTSTRSSRSGCRHAALAAAANWCWSGWRPSTSRTCRLPARW
jgi:uncharacterized protein (DUF3084 family)